METAGFGVFYVARLVASNVVCLCICIHVHTFEFAFSVTHLCLVLLNSRDLPPCCKVMASLAVTHYLDNRCVLLMIHELWACVGLDWRSNPHYIDIISHLFLSKMSSFFFFPFLSSKGLLPVLFRY